MGNITSAVGRKLNAFSQKLAENSLVKKIGAPSGAISAMLYFDQLPSAAELTALLQDRLLGLDVYSSVYSNGRWVPVDIDVSKHVIEATVGSDAEMLAYCEAEMLKPLRNGTGAPLWEVHMISNKQVALEGSIDGPRWGGRSMLFFRVEHALGDGIALNQALTRLATDQAGKPLPAATYSRPPKTGRRSLFELFCAILSAAFKYATAPIGPFDSDSPLVPRRALRSALTFSPRRKIVLVPEHGLNLIKRIKVAATDAAGGVAHTVNDVVFAATVGALRRYCLAMAPTEPLEWARMRALTPVAFPRTADAPLSNEWCFLDVPMPVGQPTPALRLRAANATFAAMKSGPEAAVAKFFTNRNCELPGVLFGHIAQQVMQRYSIVFSNVPGPASAVYVCGKKMLAVQPLYPNLIMQHLCVSYDGKMYMNFVCDPDVVTAPETLATLYMDELRALATLHGVDPDDHNSPAPDPRPVAADAKKGGGGVAEMV